MYSGNAHLQGAKGPRRGHSAGRAGPPHFAKKFVTPAKRFLSREKKIKKMIGEGFEPSPPKRLVP